MSYLDELGRELSHAGIGGRLRRRILAEFADHLGCDPEAELGSPVELARQFSDDLGTVRVRRAALAGFGALVIAGALVVAVFVATAHAGIALPRVHAPSQVLFDLGMVLTAFGGQVAFAAGVLAALRAVRRCDLKVVVREEAIVIRRRTMVAMLAGLVCVVGLALVALEASHAAGWWRALGLASAGAGALAIAAAFLPLSSALEVLPLTSGSRGDIFDDLGWLTPPPLRGRPWRLAVIVAAAIAAVIAAAGVIHSDPYDGLARGLLDGFACLTGFAVLGSYLGLLPARD
jgi:uncharacterized membrane protein YbhN (UPF0104 family)